VIENVRAYERIDEFADVVDREVGRGVGLECLGVTA
jgi:hypothetical protein